MHISHISLKVKNITVIKKLTTYSDSMNERESSPEAHEAKEILFRQDLFEDPSITSEVMHDLESKLTPEDHETYQQAVANGELDTGPWSSAT